MLCSHTSERNDDLRAYARVFLLSDFQFFGSTGSSGWASVVAVSGLWNGGSILVAHGLSCSEACGIFPDQGLNLCALHWQAVSLPLSLQGSPVYEF